MPSGETLTVTSELDNPGDWLYHCHILEHADLDGGGPQGGVISGGATTTD